MRTLRLDLEYDGAGFAGWAAQPGLRTVEGVLTEALTTLLREPVRVRVAGRTDAGVHASGQVASVETTADLEPRRLLRGLHAVLPPDLAARAVSEAPEGFDARAGAVSRRYEYRVLTAARSPLRRDRVLHHPRPLDLERMRAAAGATVGRHVFRAFTPTVTQHVHFDRLVSECAWIERDDEVVFVIEADAFLRHMVRVLVGTMLQVGAGERPPERYTPLLEGASRDEAGPTAPAHPLTLVAVRYAGEAGAGAVGDARYPEDPGPGTPGPGPSGF